MMLSHSFRRGTFLVIVSLAVVLVESQDSSAIIHPDIRAVLNNVVGANPGGRSWADSYSVGDDCYCSFSTFDHGIGTFFVKVATSSNNEVGGQWMSVVDICNLLGPGPGIEEGITPLYNDVQCGNGPPNDAGDEHTCPGRVDIGREGCGHIGPKWNFDDVEVQQQQPPPSLPPNVDPDIRAVLDNVVGANPGGLSWADSYSVGDDCYCSFSTFDHGIGTYLVEVVVDDENNTNKWMSVVDICNMLGPGPGIEEGVTPLYNDVQCGNGPPNDAGDEHTCPGRVDLGREGCGHIGPQWRNLSIVPATTTAPVSNAPVTIAPITRSPLSAAPQTQAPVSRAPVTAAPVSKAPVTIIAPITRAPLSAAPQSEAPVSRAPATAAPISKAPVVVTTAPITRAPLSAAPQSEAPVSASPVTAAPISKAPVVVTRAPITRTPISAAPQSEAPVSASPVTAAPISKAPVVVTRAPITRTPISAAPQSEAPVSLAPVTAAPVSEAPVTIAPTTRAPISAAPQTEAPVSRAPISASPVTEAPMTVAPVSSAPILTEAPAITTPEPVVGAPVMTSQPITSSPTTGPPSVSVSTPVPTRPRRTRCCATREDRNQILDNIFGGTATTSINDGIQQDERERQREDFLNNLFG